MPGVKLQVEATGLDHVNAVLERLAGLQDLTPAMRDIGEYLLRTTRDRFDEEEAPDGAPWAPLSTSYKARKRRNAGKVLTLDGHLRGNLTYQAGRDRVEVGSPSIYAGTHQFGAERGAFGTTSRGDPIPWGDIPARPVFGLTGADRDEISDIVLDFLSEKVR